MNKKNKIMLVIWVILGTVMLIKNRETARLCGDMLDICAKSLVPGIFPFLVIGNLLVECGGAEPAKKLFSGITQKITGLGGECTLPLIAGLVSGCPVGAVITAELVKKGNISEKEGEKVLCLCNNPGPAFVISAVGSALGCNMKQSVLLWVSVVLSGWMAGMFVSGYGKANMQRLRVSQFEGGGDPVSSVRKSVGTMVNVCGFVVFFGVTAGVFADISAVRHFAYISGLGEAGIRAIAGAVTETATGCFNLAKIGFPLWVKLPVCAMFLSWSGLSVHAQVCAAVKDSGLKLKKYFTVKLLQTVIAPFVMMFFMRISENAVFVASVTPTAPQIKLFVLSFLWSVAVFCGGAAIYSFFSKNKSKVKG